MITYHWQPRKLEPWRGEGRQLFEITTFTGFEHLFVDITKAFAGTRDKARIADILANYDSRARHGGWAAKDLAI